VNDSISKYQTQQVMTASPARLVCMLYDRAILSLKEAVAAIDAGQIEARWRANRRATDIIAHMWTTLDFERGGEIAANLADLFKYILSRLPEIDFRNDPAAAHEVIRLLEPLRDSWHKVANGEAGAETPSAPARRPAPAGTPSAPPRMPTVLSA
jgi:flagellar protein FliS